MFKKLVISGVLFITFAIPAHSADAALFNWIYKEGGSSFIVGSGSSIDKALESMVEKRKLTPNEIEPFVNDENEFENWENNPHIPAPPSNKYSAAPAKQTFIVTATAYSSTPDQTDDTPFVTALNTRVRDGIVAANFLPFGTEIRIPDIYGDKIFVVEDRMNKRYWHRVDIWFPERQMAKEFGVKQIRIEIIS